MIGEAYRKFLWHRATIKRNTTSQSDTGVTKFNYAVIFSDVPCNVQSNGGRVKHEEWGSTTTKKLTALFAREWAGKFEHNDLMIVNGNTFRIVTIHDSWYNSSHHVEASLEAYVPAGDMNDAG